MFDAVVALADEVPEVVTGLSHLSHEQDEALTNAIVRNVHALDRLNFWDSFSGGRCSHVEDLLVVQLASGQQQGL